MFPFSKKPTPISSSEFERELASLIVRGRLASVSKFDMIKALQGHAASLRREIDTARDARNLRTDGLHKVASK